MFRQRLAFVSLSNSIEGRRLQAVEASGEREGYGGAASPSLGGFPKCKKSIVLHSNVS
jgi:hypothetical protein